MFSRGKKSAEVFKNGSGRVLQGGFDAKDRMLEDVSQGDSLGLQVLPPSHGAEPEQYSIRKRMVPQIGKLELYRNRWLARFGLRAAVH